MTKLEALAKDCIENHTHRLVDKPTKQDIYLREESIFIQGYRQSEKRIEELEQENALLKGRNEVFEQQIMGLLIKYEEVYKRFPDLKSAMDKAQTILKENVELKEINEGYNRNRDNLIAMGFPTFKSCKEYSGKLTNLQKENATLKKQLEALSGDIPWNELKDVSEVTKKLTEVKEILQTVLDKWKEERWILQSDEEIKQIENLMKQAENFLKE